MNYNTFAELVTPEIFRGSLPQWQAEPLERIIKEGLRRGQSLQRVAYVLATGYHETSRWRYSHEINEGAGRDYGKPVLLIRGKSAAYYGRGDSQLTWLRNYALMSVELTLEFGKVIDLVNNPDLAALPEYSSYILWHGMVAGRFTGKSLADYEYPESGNLDYVGARAVVNGTDKADLIASYARQFEEALRSSGFDAPTQREAHAGFFGRIFGTIGD